MPVYKKIAQKMPSLGTKLRQANIPQDPEEYVKKTVVSSFFLAFIVCFIVFTFTRKPAFLLAAPVIFIFSFLYMIRYADVKIEKVKREVNREIVFAGRFLIIELESGVPLYNAFQNLSENYEVVGKYFGDIVGEINLGSTMEDALNAAILSTPSPELRKILWQVLNSMKTGADVSDSLNAVLDQIVREQQIEVKEYGRKLNPIAMFYMMIAIIVPSLGTTMLVVMATFVGFSLPLSAMLILAGTIGFMQFLFLAFIKSSRPPMAL